MTSKHSNISPTEGGDAPADDTRPDSVECLFTVAEWARFVAARSTAAAASSLTPIDENVRLFGPRVWARQIKLAMEEVGLQELAARIDPDVFPEGLFEQMLRLGRAPRTKPVRLVVDEAWQMGATSDDGARHLEDLIRASRKSHEPATDQAEE